jgi:hypothetical protein
VFLAHWFEDKSAMNTDWRVLLIFTVLVLVCAWINPYLGAIAAIALYGGLTQ